MSDMAVGGAGILRIADDGYTVSFWIINNSSSTYTGGYQWYGTINGVGVGGTISINGSGSYLLGQWGVTASQTVTLGQYDTGTWGLGGAASFSNWIARATVPCAPSPFSVDQQTINSIRYRFSGNCDGGSGILEWQAQRATNSSFTAGVQTVSSNGTTTFTGLTPNTTYYFRSRGRNSAGWGGWSATSSGQTLPADPPGISVLPNIPGTGSTVTLSSPGGATGVTKYTVERRVFGTTTPVTSTDTATSPLAVTGLTPGQSYEYRASAWFGTYQSPWTNWVAVTQPNPNTDAGSYFDGNSTDTPALDYQWSGAASNSISNALGRSVPGWMTFAQAATVSGGAGAVYQASGGVQGQWAARAVFFNDASAAGFRMGTAPTDGTTLADVEAGAVYFGSIYAWPSRGQRMAAVILWYTAAFGFISASVGTDQLVTAGAFTRLQVQATAPVGAQWAAVASQDVSGTGWAVWKSGEWLHQDAAMVTLQAAYPYFDGDTPDTGLYRYDWVGLANASASTRTTLQQSEIDPLLDPDCPPPPKPPAAPTINDDCITDVGTWRRYWALIPSAEVSDWLAMLPTIRVTTGGEEARQVRVRIYENPLEQSPDVFDASIWTSEQIISYMPALTTLTLDGVEQRVFASVNGSAPIPADKLLYGSNGTPATWPVLSCGIAYLLSFDVPLDGAVGNVSVGIDLTRRV